MLFWRGLLDLVYTVLTCVFEFNFSAFEVHLVSCGFDVFKLWFWLLIERVLR